ncbi:deoxyribodipyrimidine photo-lyase [Arthrobacter silviterrae]|uniref:Deoxyribodipyrimidine photo-lyase n=1 Tax=Arthrobacter silviterrae TaxID=2026658 RepID=A0ABX0DE80_9MICC|nr:deoxyribodipyrimidine photo-lyase [Arthrobacter silviterrae]MDQ0277400.1 deoxyribodipyrimidine photo-lyase [Arthrobacter silviterrae]NGN85241.1 deoxyribodipyrimidine photo-lyase [Arthrobacter silviterrae]
MTVTCVNIVWFRDDLRLTDHPALSTATQARTASAYTTAVYVLDEQSPGIRPLGAAAKWWLHHALLELRSDLAALGVPLILRQGPAEVMVPGLVDELREHWGLARDAVALFWNRRYGGGEHRADAAIKELLREQGCSVSSFPGTLLHEPWTVKTQEQSHFKVFTPFYNAAQDIPLRPVLPAPAPVPGQPAVTAPVPSDELDSWKLLPARPDWSAGLAAAWTPGEAAAQARLDLVLEEVAAGYPTGRDRPDYDGTSRLSPALRWGHLSPVQVWEALSSAAAASPEKAEGARSIMRQLAWRDFFWNQLYHQPQLPTRNLRPEFDGFDWSWPTELLPAPTARPAAGQSGTAASQPAANSLPGPDCDPVQAGIDALYTSWCTGDTGFPLVDAGMAQLWQTGWMHNRVRMVTASLLVKNLGIHWRAGEAWFWDTLVDADAASNPANWQWVAGCGADAAPYFRVFNPVLQARKFDPRGAYQTRFAAALGAEPVVDLKESRAAALTAYEHMKQASRTGDTQQ